MKVVYNPAFPGYGGSWEYATEFISRIDKMVSPAFCLLEAKVIDNAGNKMYISPRRRG